MQYMFKCRHEENSDLLIVSLFTSYVRENPSTFSPSLVSTVSFLDKISYIFLFPANTRKTKWIKEDELFIQQRHREWGGNEVQVRSRVENFLNHKKTDPSLWSLLCHCNLYGTVKHILLPKNIWFNIFFFKYMV